MKNFVYHLVFARLLNASYSRHQLKSVFWTLTIDAYMLQANILWCMVFGTDKSDVHWKKISDEDPTTLQDSFRNGLNQWAGIDRAAWDSCRKQMTEFRNKYAAHRDLMNEPLVVPLFNKALDVAFYYDKWVRKLTPAFAEPTLEATAKNVEAEVTPLIERFMTSTAC